MQHYFYHPDRGMWVAVSSEGEATYPKGTIRLPEPPQAGMVWSGTAWVQPEPEPITDADRILNRKQFTFLLRLTGFGTGWDALMNAAEAKGDRITAAALEAERAGDVFHLDRTLQVVASMREQAAKLVPDVDLSEAAIREAWTTAEQFKGIGHVSG